MESCLDFSSRLKFEADIAFKREHNRQSPIPRSLLQQASRYILDFGQQAWQPVIKRRRKHRAAKPIGNALPVVATVQSVLMKHPYCVRADKHSYRAAGVQRGKVKNFVTSFHSSRPFTAKKEFVKYGRLQLDAYKDPKPYDHRGLIPPKQLGLPEFNTVLEPDPLKLKFLNRTRPKIWGGLNTSYSTKYTSSSTIPPLKPPPKWTVELYLDPEPFPLRPCEFTRHRLQFRDPHELFLERVETELNRLGEQRKTNGRKKKNANKLFPMQM
ncbi:unnamed protein product [Dicrocoelium dendriticum]|nr:unnamed protein product [Dicrocoelium dendriticum]